MARTLVKDSAAESDLLEIWLYTVREWDSVQADRYLDGFEIPLPQLLVEPRGGKDRQFLRPGYWSVRVQAHVVFYTLTNTEVRIRRVLHGAMDADRYL